MCAALACAGARAADFYVVDLHAPDDPWVELLDPSSIVVTADGTKKAHLAYVEELDVWDDDWLEVNCTAGEYRYVSSVEHLPGDTTIPGGSTLDRAETVNAGVWRTAAKGTLAAKIFDAVCDWSPGLLTDSTRLSADSLEAVVHRVSDRLANIEDSGK